MLSSTLVDQILRLLLAAAMGALIGLERRALLVVVTLFINIEI
jgi:uncharacterized membrane protein YhiD involved in acid resistance